MSLKGRIINNIEQLDNFSDHYYNLRERIFENIESILDPKKFKNKSKESKRNILIGGLNDIRIILICIKKRLDRFERSKKTRLTSDYEMELYIKYLISGISKRLSNFSHSHLSSRALYIIEYRNKIIEHYFEYDRSRKGGIIISGSSSDGKITSYEISLTYGGKSDIKELIHMMEGYKNLSIDASEENQNNLRHTIYNKNEAGTHFQDDSELHYHTGYIIENICYYHLDKIRPHLRKINENKQKQNKQKESERNRFMIYLLQYDIPNLTIDDLMFEVFAILEKLK